MAVDTMDTFEGVLLRSELEGDHFELQGRDGSLYVVVPGGEAVRDTLAAVVGRCLRVRGYVHRGPSIFMSGPVLRVVEVEVCSVSS